MDRQGLCAKPPEPERAILVLELAHKTRLVQSTLLLHEEKQKRIKTRMDNFVKCERLVDLTFQTAF